MTKTVYYPKIKQLAFYDKNGVVIGGFIGDIAEQKYQRMKLQRQPLSVSYVEHVPLWIVTKTNRQQFQQGCNLPSAPERAPV